MLLLIFRNVPFFSRKFAPPQKKFTGFVLSLPRSKLTEKPPVGPIANGTGVTWPSIELREGTMSCRLDLQLPTCATLVNCIKHTLLLSALK